MGKRVGVIGRWAVAVCVLLEGGAAAQTQTLDLPPALISLWQATGLPDASLSLVVQEIGGPRLVALNAQQPRNPASVMKLITTWAALSELGPNYTWRTEFLVDPGVHPDARGVLRGPLYLRASGDPQLLLQDVWTLLRELRLRGVKQIGDLVIDRGIFGDVTIDPGAFDDARDRAYNASPDAFMVGFGALRLLFTPDPAGGKWVSAIEPPLPGLRMEGQLEWLGGNCTDEDISTDPVVTPHGVSIRIMGKMAGSCGEFSLYRLALSQYEYATAVFRLLWRELGGTFKGKVRTGPVPLDAVRLAWHDSPMLAETIRTINKYSNNVMTRMLLLTLGAERGCRPATVIGSAAVATDVLRRQGLSASELIIDNGAGLSRDARVSADSLMSLLNLAWNSPYMPEFISSLSIAGLDGTRQHSNATVQGMAHLKTGTLRDVKALAGYVQGATGKRYMVVSLVNHEQAASVGPFNDALIEWLVKR